MLSQPAEMYEDPSLSEAPSGRDSVHALHALRQGRDALGELDSHWTLELQ